MSTNISGKKREALLSKIAEIKTFIEKNADEKNASQLLGYLGELSREVNGKKYGLVFEEHREKIDELLEENAPVFIEEKKLFVDNGGELNFLLEGDNLASLKLLEKTHRGKIDVIYIDPPYNTGSNDFCYDDNYVEKDDSFLHSKWLSFMNSRLKIAYSLLKDTGCILISINENEVFGLKFLCDEIFGEENYLTTFAVKVRHENRILKGDKDFHEVFEYLLFYRKSNKHKTSKRIFDNTSNEEYVWTLKELEPPCDTLKMGNKEVDVFKPEQYKLEKTTPSVSNFKRISIRGSIKEGNSSGRFFMANLNKFLGKKTGYMFKVKNMGDDGFGFRYFLIPENQSRKNGDYLQGVPQFRAETKDVPYANLLDFEADFNNVGYEGGVEFRNGKKPLAFLKHCFDMSGLSIGSKTVLDFFAGSGSTGHALLEYNIDRSTKHKFILCTNNENNICRDITYQRLKTAITGKRKDKSKYSDGLPGSLKYFKTDFIPISEKMYYEYADELLLHVRELVELENAVNFDKDASVAIVLDDDEMDEFIDKICHSEIATNVASEFHESQTLNQVHGDRARVQGDKASGQCDGARGKSGTSTTLSDRRKILCDQCKTLYLGHDVLLSSKQERILKAHNISVNVIPDYYYRELAL